MKDSTGLTIIMIVLVLILCGVVWHRVRIEKLYKNYHWMYETQCELVGGMNYTARTVGKLCIIAMMNGDAIGNYNPNDPNGAIIIWFVDPNDPNEKYLISNFSDPNKGELK